MPDSIRIGIVGAGGNTRNKHIPQLQDIDGVDIVCVANRSRESAQAVADDFGIPNFHDHWQQVIDDPDVDAVVIGTWPYMHCPVTCAALAAGKHVLVEARMAMNAAEAHEMLETSRHHPNLVAQVVPSPFTFKWDATIHDYVHGGKLGDLIAVDLRGGTGSFPDASGPANWRQDRDLSGYNIMAMGIWYEALMRWTGPATAVTAMTQTVVKRRPAADGQGYVPMTIPDHVDVLAPLAIGGQARMQFTSVLGHASAGWGCSLYGSEGTLHLDARAGTLHYGSRDSKELVEVAIAPEKAASWRVEAEFIDAIRGVAPVRLTTFADGVRYMEFTEAVTRSAQLGQSVPLPL